MANLRREDRGQIILVAAFALAIIFVAMALIVNSAIFTENLASRGETSGADGALSMRANVEANVGDAVTAANRNDNGSVSELNDAVRASIRNISRQTGSQSARSGRLVDVGYNSATNGTRIYKTNSSNFTNSAGTEDYRVVSGVSRVTGGDGTRAFEIDASNISATGNSSAFEVRAQQSGATGNQNSWRARIWNASGNDSVHVRTLKNDSSTTVIEDCEVNTASSSVRIALTEGTINGEECDALGTAPTGDSFHFGAGTNVGPSDTYNIAFANAGNITGNFSMVVHPLTGSLTGLASGLGEDHAIYDVTVNYTYFTTDLRYQTEVRVAPGEPDV